ncbi:MAG: hypothetical protein D6715_05370 [Calditrichaeota bacterium]|nr:MAG: hypothetical protein D6715_05370 [Calditrichota bacterium]
MMRRTFVLLMLGVAVLMGARPVRSATYRGGETVHIAAGDTVRGNLFAGARYVDIEGVVTGNVYLSCEVARITGQVQGTVHAFLRRLEVRGSVGDQVLFFGESMILDGPVDGDVLAFGRSVELTSRAQLGGDLMVGCAELMLTGGRVAGGIRGGAGHAYLNGRVAGPVNLKLKEIHFGEAFSAPAVHLTLKRPLSKSKMGAAPENLTVDVVKTRRFYQRIYFYWSIGAMIVVGLLMVALGKHRVEDMLAVARQRPLAGLGSGFLALVATPVAAILLIVLILTIPVGIILLVSYFISLYLSYVLSSMFVGNWILRRLRGNGSAAGLALSVVLGVVLLALLEHVPHLGGLIKLLALCLGLGMITLSVWHSRKPAPSEQ